MCGRYTLFQRIQFIFECFGLDDLKVEIRPRYNIAPGQEVPIILNTSLRRVVFHKWGLIPRWARDPAIGNKLINARAETLAEKPSFREAYRMRRCLILADGFYEWKREGAARSPMYFQQSSGLPFAFAGLWETWKSPEGKEIRTCTIITTAADEFLAPIHDRMPVILPKEVWDAWLDPKTQEPSALAPLLKPLSAEHLRGFAVSKLVNNPKNDRPECVERV